MRRILLLAILMLGTRAFAASPAKADTPLSFPVLSGAFTVSKAMTAIYGTYDETNEASPWPTKRIGVFPLSPPGKVWITKLLEQAYQEDGIEKHLLITSARRFIHGMDSEEFDSNTCHACGVLIGVAVFTQEGSGWKVELSDLKFTTAGAWGLPPQELALHKMGDHVHGFVYYQTDMHQGEAESYFAAFAPMGSHYRLIFSEAAETAAFDKLTDKCYDKVLASDKKKGEALAKQICHDPDEKVEFVPPTVPGPKSAFFDLRLVRTFAETEGAKPVEIVDWYRLNDKRKEYVHKPRTASTANSLR